MKANVRVGSMGALLAIAATLIGTSANDAVPNAHAADLPYMRQLEALRASDGVLPPKLPRIQLYAMYNREAPIPPQCYTRTEGKYNPCYVCHQDAIAGRENVMNDHDLQAEYSFSEAGLENHWLNLFQDRRERIARISDAQIMKWIDQDNYSELAPRLKAADFKGWIPDLKNLHRGAAAFDDHGFARDGSHWVAFNYKPLPSTFWPTNGATDDVMIRLPPEFRSDARNRYSREVYLANLSLLEANIKGYAQIGTLPIDEARVDADLDADGHLGRIDRVAIRDRYVGAARGVRIVPFVYPLGTEFLHTVRYVGVDKDVAIVNSRRIKEVRYMRRWLESSHENLQLWYAAQNSEKEKGELPAYQSFGHRGLGGPMGWQIAGFIENRAGRLRESTFEETMFCMGCHNSIGSTIDKTFSFARKVDGASGWKYIDLRGMPDAPNVGETAGEIATYLARAGGGSEFRNNAQMQQRWFHADGRLDSSAVARARDVYELITPSVERALLLNKAYKVIVEEQSYLFGRDPMALPPQNVYRRVDAATAPTLPAELQYRWDIRLNWAAARQTLSASNE